MKNIVSSFISILRWGIIAAVIGAVCGLVGTGFWYAVNWSDGVLQAHGWLLYLLPLAGVLIVWMNERATTEGCSTDSVIGAVQEGGGDLPWILVPVIFAGTVITHFFGGSSGREGAAFQIGGTIGSRIAAMLHQNDYEIRIATMAGMAALFSAIFGLPVTATIFVVLVISVGSFWHSSIYPVMIASLVAYGIAGFFGVKKVAFTAQIPSADLTMVLRIGLLAVLCAILSTVLCDALHDTEKLMKKWMPDPYIRVVTGGILVCVIMMVMSFLNQAGMTGTWSMASGKAATGAGLMKSGNGGSGLAMLRTYSGAGSDLIRLAIEQGKARPWDFILKLLLTVLTLAAGYKGGEVLPSFAIGATFGCVVGPLLGIPASFGAAIGLISVFGGASNSLIAPIFLGIEMFGAQGIHYYAIAAVLSYLMSGYAGFYYNQVIVYSKIAPVKLNLHTNDVHDQMKDLQEKDPDERQMPSSMHGHR